MSQLQRVTKEQAVKLKEAGFNWKCGYYYDTSGDDLNDKLCMDNHNRDIEYWSAPELDLACKFLREVKGIDINPILNTPWGKYKQDWAHDFMAQPQI